MRIIIDYDFVLESLDITPLTSPAGTVLTSYCLDSALTCEIVRGFNRLENEELEELFFFFYKQKHPPVCVRLNLINVNTVVVVVVVVFFFLVFWFICFFCWNQE